ncbi:unnamed protein product, partial [Ectocarpus sp. 8 AP-2014]
NQQAPLEAGEDGTFDVGDASPPPSPPKRVGSARSKQNATATAVSTAPATDGDPCGSPPIKDDWEKVDVDGADEGLPPPAGNASQGREAAAPPSAPEYAQEDFQDAVETQDESATQQTGTGATTTEDGSSCGVDDSPGKACGQQRPPGLGGRVNVIASGLANVRLPMGYGRQRGQEEEDGLVDSDGEEQFHDAQDSGPGVVKDATKAREMKEAGNEHYKNGEFEDAVDYYTMALHYCPEDEAHKKDRAVFLANRAQGHLRLEEYETVVDDCTAALELDPSYVKALLRRAQANEQLEKYDMALEDSKELLKLDPSLRLAKESVPRLEKLHNDKNEKMKEEAIGE